VKGGSLLEANAWDAVLMRIAQKRLELRRL